MVRVVNFPWVSHYTCTVGVVRVVPMVPIADQHTVLWVWRQHYLCLGSYHFKAEGLLAVLLCKLELVYIIFGKGLIYWPH